MKIESNGLDIKIEQFSKLDPELILFNEDEKINLEFELDKTALEHTAEQFISALFDYDENLAHKLYQEFGNVADLKEELEELKEELAEVKEFLYQAER